MLDFFNKIIYNIYIEKREKENKQNKKFKKVKKVLDKLLPKCYNKI